MVQKSHILFCSLIQNMYVSVTVTVFTPKVSSILENLENNMSLTRKDHHNYTMNFKRARVIQRDQLLKLGILKIVEHLVTKENILKRETVCGS